MRTPMQCYSVIGGFDYEGEDFDSLKLFDCRSSADAYCQKLVEVEGFDYVKIYSTSPVSMSSRIWRSSLPLVGAC